MSRFNLTKLQKSVMLSFARKFVSFCFLGGLGLSATLLEGHASSSMIKEQGQGEVEPSMPSDEASGGTVLSKPFSDGFEGAGFKAPWLVGNEKQDSYILENGAALFVVEGKRQMLESKEPANLLTLPGRLPDADYSLVLDVRLDAHTMEEHVMLGLRNEADDYLVADLFVRRTGCGPYLMLATHNRRQLREEEKAHNTRVERDLMEGIFTSSPCHEEGRKQADAILEVLREKGARLSLKRQGYQYRVMVELAFEGETLRYQTPILTRFEAMSNPVIHVGKEGGHPGTGVVHLDHFSFQPQM